MNNERKYFLTATSDKAVSIGTIFIQPMGKPIMITESEFEANKDIIEYHVHRKNIAVISPGDKSYNTLVKRVEAAKEMESKIPRFVPPRTLKIDTPLGRYNDIDASSPEWQCIALSVTTGRRCERRAEVGGLCKLHAKLAKSNKTVVDYMGNPVDV